MRLCVCIRVRRAIASRPRLGATTLTDPRCAPALMGRAAVASSADRLVSPLRSVDPSDAMNSSHPPRVLPRTVLVNWPTRSWQGGRCVPLPPAPGHRLLKVPGRHHISLCCSSRTGRGRLPSADTTGDRHRSRPSRLRAYAAAAHDAFTAARPGKGTDRARGSSGQAASGAPRTACWWVGGCERPGRGVASKSSLARTGSASAGAGASRP